MSYIPQLNRTEAEILDRELHDFDTEYTDIGAILQALYGKVGIENKRQKLNEALRRINNEFQETN